MLFACFFFNHKSMKPSTVLYSMKGVNTNLSWGDFWCGGQEGDPYPLTSNLTYLLTITTMFANSALQKGWLSSESIGRSNWNFYILIFQVKQNQTKMFQVCLFSTSYQHWQQLSAYGTPLNLSSIKADGTALHLAKEYALRSWGPWRITREVNLWVEKASSLLWFLLRPWCKKEDSWPTGAWRK